MGALRAPLALGAPPDFGGALSFLFYRYRGSMNRSKKITAVAAALSCVLAACTAPQDSAAPSTAGSEGSTTALPRIDAVTWRCVKLVDPSGNPVELSGRPPTLRISAEGKASGFAGVNRYFADATFGNSSNGSLPLRFGPVGATRMAGPPERAAIESAFVAMLDAVRSSRITASGSEPMLVMQSEKGDCAWFSPQATE